MNSFYAKDRDQWRKWLADNASHEKEVWLIYYKKHSRKPSISHEDAVRQAICYGWIDGVIKRLDAERTLRKFTPRKPESLWSTLNIRRAEELIRSQEMTPAGLLVYKPERKRASQPVALSEETTKLFRQNKTAWRNFQAFPPYYRRVTAGWVESAKKPETRLKRIIRLIESSAANKKIEFMTNSRK
jgi:uncharacterized protein YdeI (YjbR/CyaY-like superfamily)